MRSTDLSELAAFDAVARHRNFRRAGEERGVTASAISHAVGNLEARVGIRPQPEPTPFKALLKDDRIFVSK